MELYDFMLLGLVSCAVSAVVSIIAAMVSHVIRNRDFYQLRREFESLDMSVKGYAGRNSRQEKAERQASAMAEAAALLQAGKKPDEIMKALLPKYPDIALDLAKKHIGL